MGRSVLSVKKGFFKSMGDARSKILKNCAQYALEISIWLKLENVSQSSLAAWNIWDTNAQNASQIYI